MMFFMIVKKYLLQTFMLNVHIFMLTFTLNVNNSKYKIGNELLERKKLLT